MEILGVGPGELLLVVALALIFIGPRRMPEVASQLGKAIREFQKASAELTQAIGAEIEAAEAEKAAIQAAQEAVLTTTATGDIISEAEEIAARAEREYDESVAASPALSGDVPTEHPVTEAVAGVSQESAAAPAAATRPISSVPGMGALPLSLLTASNASAAELAAILAPAAPEATQTPGADASAADAGQAEGGGAQPGQTVIPGLSLLPDSLLLPSAARVEVARPAFAASYLGLGMPRPRMTAQPSPPLDPLPEALVVPSTGAARG